MKLIILMSLFFLVACVNTNSLFEAKEYYVELHSDIEIRLPSGEIELVTKTEENKSIYKIYFEPVHGGSAYLFGQIKIKEQNGHAYKRMTILKNDALLVKYSIEDLELLQAQLPKGDSIIHLLVNSN